VPLNFRQAPRDIAQMLEDAQCRVLFVDCASLPLLDDPALVPACDATKSVIVMESQLPVCQARPAAQVTS
jgi:hypothetical protein